MQVFFDAREPGGVGIERQHLAIGAFEHMPGLAAGRGTSVEHPHAGFDFEQGRGQLGACVLYRPPALREPRQRLHRTRGVEHHGIGCRPRTDARERMGLQAGVGQRGQHLLARGAAPVDAQSHRPRALARSEDVLPMFGMVTLEQFDPPGGKVLARHHIAGERRPQTLAFTQIPAQDRVDEAFRALGRGFHGLVDQGVCRIRRFRVDELGQRANE